MNHLQNISKDGVPPTIEYRIYYNQKYRFYNQYKWYDGMRLRDKNRENEIRNKMF